MHIKSQDLEKTSADTDSVHDTMSEEDPWPEAISKLEYQV